MLPNLVVIGGTTCGTSSLYHYLGRHPEIFMSKVKELRYFLDPFWGNGQDWYEAQFANGSAPVRGEASPQYTRFPKSPGVAERMHSVIPDAKLIYLVRDPIERIVSSYVSDISTAKERRSFREAITEPAENLYLWESSYHMQLQQYLEHFPMEQILVVQSEALRDRRRPTLRRIFGFLGVDESFDDPYFDKIRNSSHEQKRVEGQPRWMKEHAMPSPRGRIPWDWRERGKKILYAPFLKPIERPEVDDDLREHLVERLRPDADRLRELTGMPLEGWSV